MPGKASFRSLAGLAVVVLTVAFLLGPRTTVNTEPRSSPPIPGDLQALDTWLQQSEDRFGDVVDGAEKNIVWADPAHRSKTDYVVVYLHGFSATRQEIAPVPQNVAGYLNANLYLPRIHGHGRGSEAFSDSTAAQWIDSTWQAWHIARRLGEKVIVMGTSTGVTLAYWLLKQQGVQEHIHSLVFVSPNFGLKGGASRALTYPWAETWVPWVLGKEYAWEPANPLQAKYWTYRYSVKVVLQMQALVDWVNEQDYSQIDIPALFIYSDYDQVVDPERIGEIFQQWNGRKERMAIDYVQDSSNHVIVGDILAPQNNEPVFSRIVTFIDGVNDVAAKSSPPAERAVKGS